MNTLQDGSLLLDQEAKLNENVNKFDLSDSKSNYTPMIPNYYNVDSKTNQLEDNVYNRKAWGLSYTFPPLQV